jgi:hypothetical protein
MCYNQILQPKWWGSPLVQEKMYQEKSVKKAEKKAEMVVVVVVVMPII